MTNNLSAWDGLANYPGGWGEPTEVTVKAAKATRERDAWKAANDKGLKLQAERGAAMAALAAAERDPYAMPDDVAALNTRRAEAEKAIARNGADALAKLRAFDVKMRAWSADTDARLEAGAGMAAEGQAELMKAYAALREAFEKREDGYRLAGLPSRATRTWRAKLPFAQAIDPTAAARKLIDDFRPVVEVFPEDVTTWDGFDFARAKAEATAKATATALRVLRGQLRAAKADALASDEACQLAAQLAREAR